MDQSVSLLIWSDEEDKVGGLLKPDIILNASFLDRRLEFHRATAKIDHEESDFVRFNSETQKIDADHVE